MSVGNKHVGLEKNETLINEFKKASGESYTGNLFNNVNFATAEEMRRYKMACGKNLHEAIKERQTPVIHSEPIVIEPNQKALNLVFRNGLNIMDMSNPMYGDENKTNKKRLRENIIKADANNNKVCVIYGGDLLGEEWEFKRLNNAKIIEVMTSNSNDLESNKSGDSDGSNNVKSESVKKILFFGLGQRVKALKRDIEFALKFPGVDIYLMSGAQEEKINKYFKIDVLEQVVKDLNNPRVHYIKGVNSIVNIEKKNEYGPSNFATIGLLTNNSLSKARKGQPAVSAVKLNSGDNLADVVFVTNTNIAGKKGPNMYYPSSESTFIETATKKRPVERPHGCNRYSINVIDNKEVTVIEGGNMPQSNPLEMIVYEKYFINQIACRILIERQIEKINQFALPTNKDPIRSFQLQLAKEQLNGSNKSSEQADQSTNMEM